MTIRRSDVSQYKRRKRQPRQRESAQRAAGRRLLLESLEARQLLAVGPQLAGIQPNNGDLLQDGQVLNVAPQELLFLFNGGESIDTSTLSGIQIMRSGLDGAFQRANTATDFGTNGAVVMDFEATNAGESGNGITLDFIQNDLGANAGPNVQVRDETIFVELNNHPTTPTRASELLTAINNHADASLLVTASIRAGGNPNTAIAGSSPIRYSPVTLDGANRASATSNFNAGSRLELKFTAVAEGPQGNGTQVVVTRTDRGGVAPPRVTVVNGIVQIEMNSNAASPTTADEIVSAVNNHPQASQIVSVTLQSGSASTVVGNRSTTFSPIRLFGANDVLIEPGFIGLGNSSREVVFRFKETLPDDLYHVAIVGTGDQALRNVDGEAFGDRTSDGLDNGRDFSLEFELDLGALVLSIVPQPVTRNEVTNALRQARDRIDVYFNDDDMHDTVVQTSTTGGANPTVVDPAFYQLIFTNDTVHNTDNDVYHPSSITYDPDSDLAVLLFDAPLDELGSGAGTFRLRIGTDENLLEDVFLPPLLTAPIGDQGSSFATAQAVGLSLNVRGDGTDITDGQTLRITNEQSVVTTFEFNDPASGTPVAGTNIEITFNPAMTQNELADVIAAAINGAGLGVTASTDGTVIQGQLRIALTGAQRATATTSDDAVRVDSLRSLVISSTIDALPYDLDFPGANDEPGNREIPLESHLLFGADQVAGISTIPYNFGDLPGPFLNLITAAQKDRVREVFQIYGDLIGAQFVETVDAGFTIATGDMRALDPTIPTGPGGVLGVASPLFQILVLDNAENWDDTYGATDDPQKFSYFEVALHEIGHLLGLGHASELPPVTILAGQGIGEFNLQFGNPLERVYPGSADLVHAQHIWRPEGRDIDMYRVELDETGLFSAEIMAERNTSSSLLDAVVTVYRQMPDGSRELIARNDDYFSTDSYLELPLGAGTYWIGVSASGNDAYDPAVEDSGLGGVTQGEYDLRLNFRPDADRTLRDATGIPLDGDADGTPGGVYNFWLAAETPANTLFVDKAYVPPPPQLPQPTTPVGSIDNPFTTIANAYAAAQPGDIVRIVGNGGEDRIMGTQEDNLAYEVGFDSLSRVLSDGSTMEAPQGVTVMIDSGTVIKARRARLGVGSSSPTVDRSGAALQVLGTPVLLDSFGDVVRDSNGVPLPGSVYLTSLNDTTVGMDMRPGSSRPNPAPGDWGGLAFQSDIDRADATRVDLEARGLFLNHISNADIRYGGGTVVVDGIPRVTAPIDLIDTRASIFYNTITRSAVAAIAASPDSFAETNFHSPRFQFTPFTSEYQRVGPDIDGNTLTDNSINALFVRATTPAGGQLRPITVSARWDDRDVTHVVAENLVVRGTPGGPISDVQNIDLSLVTLDALTLMQVTGNGGAVSDGQQMTISDQQSGVTLTFEFDSNGVLSDPTNQRIAFASTTTQAQLTAAIAASINMATFNVTATVSGNQISLDGAETVTLDPGLTVINVEGGELPAGDYTYRITFVDADGNEAAPSQVSDPVTLAGTQNAALLQNLPLPTSGFVSRRLYRNANPGDPTSLFTLVAELNSTDTSYLDVGGSLGITLQDQPGDLRARLDARLAVDPGVIVKLNGATIETSFGGHLIAEGLAGQPVIFTSANDDRYGAGGTFDTTQNGATDAQPGDWGGLYLGPMTRGSLDFAQVSYGGGVTRIQGSFAGFNAIEIQQADARIAHSLFENNADGDGGQATANRAGRGENDPALLFVRGSQPIIVDNVIVDNAGPVININANALDFTRHTDIGRTTYNRGESGPLPIQRMAGFEDNEGPLVRLNKLNGNEINGMQVRGATLSTQGVWDDSDIVHVLQDQTVYTADLHTYGGLRLESSPNESLVVKMIGDDAGFTATGRPLDIDDRIGGALQVIGQPNRPVVFTSLDDCTVGAGFTPDGVPMNDTINSNACGVGPTAEVPFVDVIVVIDESGSMFGSQQFTKTLITDLEAALVAAGIGDGTQGINRYGLVGFGGSSFGGEEMGHAHPVGAGGALYGDAVEYVTAVDTLTISGAFEDGYSGVQFALDNYSFRPQAENFIILITDEDRDILEPQLTFNTTLAGLNAADVTLETIITADIQDAQGIPAMAIDSLNTVYIADGQGGFTTSPNGTLQPGFFFDMSVPDYGDLSLATGGLVGDISVIAGFFGTATDVTTSFSNALSSQIVVQAGGGSRGTPGDWNSLLIDTFANDRNVQLATESESPGLAAPGNNALPRDAQFVGALAPDEKSGDETLRLGFEIHGLLSARDDIDVYSFDGQAGKEVWLDIDRTSVSLDSVIEVIDASGTVLARSDDSVAEGNDESLLFRGPQMAVNHVQSLTKSAFGVPDLYTTNLKDAGMRVVLPGSANSTNTYFVRVRSSSPNLSQLDGGQTKGAYQLQIRLREVDEFPGSTIQYSDIRFATNGIEVLGQPKHSPLLGEATEAFNAAGAEVNDAFGTAQPLGNVLNTDRGALGIAGEVLLPDDVDWFQFDVEYDSVQSSGGTSHASLIVDVDYADGFARPNTNVWIFDDQGNLVAVGSDSNVAEDRGDPLDAASADDLSRGSAGALDPFIGPISFPAAGTASGRYFIAVASNAVVPAEIEQFLQASPTNPLARLEPVNSLVRVADQQDLFTSNGALDNNVAFGPQVPVLFDQTSFQEFTLSDVKLFVNSSRTTDRNTLRAVDPFTGAVENVVGNINANVDDIALHPQQGLLYGFSNPQGGTRTDGNTGNYIQIDPRLTTTTNLGTNLGDDGIETYNRDPQNPQNAIRSNNNNGVGIRFDALALGDDPATAGLSGYAIGARGDANFAFGVPDQRNLLYEFNPTTGAAFSNNPPGNRSGNTGNNPLIVGAHTQIVEHGALDTDNDPFGPGNTVLLGADATVVNAAFGTTTFQITDASGSELPGPVRFSVADGAGGIFDFEFNAGPEVRFVHSPQTGVTIRDGDTFFLDLQPYEFDTGTVMVVTATGNTIQDGDTFTITDVPPPPQPGQPQRLPITRVFEFDRQGGLNDNNAIPVPFTLNDNNLQIISAIVNAVNLSAQFNAQAVAVGQRISILNENALAPMSESAGGPTLFLQGAPGVRPGAVAIPSEESFDANSFGNAIDQALNGAVNASRDGDRINFSGAVDADFTNIVTRGVFTDIGSDGRVAPNFIPVNFLAADTATEIATRIVDAINANTPVNAVQRGTGAELQGGATFMSATEPPLRIGGTAPGGDITGMAFVGGRLFAVTGDDPRTFGVVEGGGLYEILSASSNFAIADYVETASDLLTAGTDIFGTPGPIQFTALTAGPQNAENGRFADMLFATDVNGVLYAFDTTGALQPVFVDGQTSVETGLFQVDGLAFSNLDFNLWHETDSRNADPGHGVEQVFDGSRRTEPDAGNNSFYFGYEDPGENGIPSNGETNPNNALDYDFIGGAHGTMISNPFSLEGYSSEDLPTLYYTYYLDTENANADLNTNQLMRDSFRAYISGEDGEWHLLSTNNSDRGGGDFDDEFDDFDPFDDINVPVQENFDVADNGAPDSWRQVRVPLASFAGQDNLRIKFDFDSAGGRGPSDTFIFGDSLRQNTVGFELRTVDGARLRDQQTFTFTTIDNFGFPTSTDTFELDFGYTLVAPSGSAITEGSLFTVDGVDYIFDSDGVFNRNIQAIAGTLLVDGGRFSLSDGTQARTFEFEDMTIGDGVQTGNVVVSFDPTDTVDEIAQAIETAIGGSGLNLTATANGSVVELTGTAPAFSPLDSGLQLESAFAVPYTPENSASEVGRSIANAIAQNPPATPIVTDDLTAEPNDTILEAIDTTLTGRAGVFQGSGAIGDNFDLLAPGLDVDFLSFDLQVGDVVEINVDANALGSTLNGMLILFDDQGTPLAFSFDNSAPGEQPSLDPYINFTAPLTGTYFVGVSGEPNFFYDPLLSPSGQAGSTGEYEIDITVTDAAGLLHRNGHRINLPNSQMVTQTGLPAGSVEGSPGVTNGFAVNLHAGMNSTEVASAIASSLGSFYANGERQAFKNVDEILSIIGHTFSNQSAGPLGGELLGVSLPLVGDQFGAFEESTNTNGTTNAGNQGALGMQNNDHEGVYIDDIVIGFAERGELVSGATGLTNFVNNAAQPGNEIDVGAYQVEIRRGPEFGFSDPPPLPTFPLIPLLGARAFDTNDRQTEQTSILAPPGEDLADGQSFVLSDGVDQLIFEFDDLGLPLGNPDRGVTPGHVRLGFRASQTANQIAELIRDAINGNAVQQVLEITAGLADGANGGTISTSVLVNLHGNAAVTGLGDNVGVSGSINDIGSALGSDNLFTFNNNSTAGDQITQIRITLPDPQFFDPLPNGNSGPDVSPTSDPVGPTFTFTQDVNVDDTIIIDFTDFDPGETFIFGNDVDLSNDPVDNIGAMYEVVFSSGQTVSGSFTAQGAGPGQVAVLDAGGVGITSGQFTEFGDTNIVREQGQVLIHANRITNSQQFGILADAASRDVSSLAPLAGDLPHAGPTRVTREVNTQRLVTGVTISNNVVARSGQGGIRFSGDASAAGLQLASVPFGRIVNNTVTGGGVGIQVDENASPTLLNNIVAGFTTGISVDASSSSAVIGGTIYQDNGTDVQGTSLGSFPIVLVDGDPLFVNPTQGNFYLAPGARAIDSSVESLQDRPALVTVRAPLGFSESPILTPDLDAIGQTRVDDPSVDTPPGQGANIFKDRGALDRADFAGPSAILLNPQDNDTAALDADPNVTFVELTNQTLANFSIQLLDGIEPTDPQDGTGADDSTVRSDRVSLFRDGVRLLEGLDYSFNYDATNNIIRLTPLAGIWELDHRYEIRLSNLEGFVIAAPPGNAVDDGDQFDVLDNAGNTVTFEFESGYSLLVPQTLTLQVPADGGLSIVDGEMFTISDGIDTEVFEFDRNGVFVDGNIVINYTPLDSANEIANEIVTAINSVNLELSPRNIVNFGGRAVHLGSQAIHTLDTTATTLAQTGIAGGIEEDQTFTIDDGTKVVTFQFTSGTPSLGSRSVNFSLGMTHEELADAIVTAIRNGGVGLLPTHDARSDGLVHVGGERRHIIDVSNSQLTLTGTPGVQPEWGLQIPTVAGAPDFQTIMDGEFFTIDNGAGETLTVELDNDGTTTAGNIVVTFNTNSTTTNQLANAIAIAVRNANIGLSPTNAGLGRILFGGTTVFSLDATNTTLVEIGLPGVPAAEPVIYRPGSTYDVGVPVLEPIFTSANMAQAIATAVNSASARLLLEDVVATTNLNDGEVVLDGVQDVTGVVSLFRSNVRDIAGNALQANRDDGTTTFQITIGSGLDYGDAPEPYATLDEDNGASHQIVADLFLGQSIDIDFDGQPSAAADGDDQDGTDDEDGVANIAAGEASLVGASLHSITVTASKDGMLDAWVDFNDDGDWNDVGEQIFSSQALVAGENLLSFTVPGTAAQGQTYARFRLSSSGGLSPNGFADDGEVEDYLVNIAGNPWRNPVNPRDVNGDSFVSAIDALVLINTINRGELSAQTPLPNPPDRPIPPYLDANGDGFLTSGDVLFVINFLNAAAGGEGEGESSLIVDHRLPSQSLPTDRGTLLDEITDEPDDELEALLEALVGG